MCHSLSRKKCSSLAKQILNMYSLYSLFEWTVLSALLPNAKLSVDAPLQTNAAERTDIETFHSYLLLALTEVSHAFLSTRH